MCDSLVDQYLSNDPTDFVFWENGSRKRVRHFNLQTAEFYKKPKNNGVTAMKKKPVIKPSDFIEARLTLNLTQAKLAERMGVQINTISRWENGRRRIPMMAWKFLKMLQVTR